MGIGYFCDCEPYSRGGNGEFLSECFVNKFRACFLKGICAGRKCNRAGLVAALGYPLCHSLVIAVKYLYSCACYFVCACDIGLAQLDICSVAGEVAVEIVPLTAGILYISAGYDPA